MHTGYQMPTPININAQSTDCIRAIAKSYSAYLFPLR